MAGWTTITPSGADPGSGSAYLYEDAGALKYRGTSGSAATIVNADGTMSSGSSTPSISVKKKSGNYYRSELSGNTNLAAAIDNTYYIPMYTPTDITIDRISLRTHSTFSGVGSTVRLGIYNDVDGVPSTVLLDAGTVSPTASNTTYEITISQAVSAGIFWLAFNQQNLTSGTGAFVGSQSGTTGTPYGLPLATSSSSNATHGYVQSSVTGAFGTASSLTASTSVPYVLIRVA